MPRRGLQRVSGALASREGALELWASVDSAVARGRWLLGGGSRRNLARLPRTPSSIPLTPSFTQDPQSQVSFSLTLHCLPIGRAENAEILVVAMVSMATKPPWRATSQP